jgi:transmembrane sensor
MALIFERKFVFMDKSFMNVEEMAADEMFLSWFYEESDEKVKAWENWLNENPGYQPLATEAVEMMDALNTRETPVSGFRVEAAYDKLNIRLVELEKDMAPVVTMKPARKKWWIGAAAAVLITIAGLTFFKFSSSKSVIKTQYGQISQQKLPDGSEVMLNANSIVTLSQGWNEGRDREVWLKGEAFFHVKKTPQKNLFIVHTNQLDIIVTGTQFNVRTSDDKTSVLLTEGSVTIKTNDGQEIHMMPGDFVEMRNDMVEKKIADKEKVLAWKENKLLFENTPMAEAIKIISNHYGVKITLANESIGRKTISGMMPNDNLDVLLRALEATNNFKITRTNKDIIISEP